MNVKKKSISKKTPEAVPVRDLRPFYVVIRSTVDTTYLIQALDRRHAEEQALDDDIIDSAAMVVVDEANGKDEHEVMSIREAPSPVTKTTDKRVIAALLTRASNCGITLVEAARRGILRLRQPSWDVGVTLTITNPGHKLGRWARLTLPTLGGEEQTDLDTKHLTTADWIDAS